MDGESSGPAGAGFGAEERRLLDDSLQSYFSDSYPYEHFRHLSAGEALDREAWSAYAGMGWLGIAAPEALGGSGGGMTELGILLAAAGRHLALEPFVATLVLGIGALERAGTDAQKTLVTQAVEGKLLLSLCHYEPRGGYARGHVETVATEESGGYCLRGEKTFTLHANAADTLIVSARLGDAAGPVGLFLVTPHTKGMQLTVTRALDGRRGAAVKLNEARIDGAALLGGASTDRSALIDSLLDRAAIAVAAEAAGAMAAVSAATVEYLKSRQQFGQPLSKFQVLQHRLVDMSIAGEETRAMVHHALAALDRASPDAQRSVWQAKALAAQSARFVGGQSVQLHGGMGMTDELAIGHYYKRLSFCEAQFGDAGWYLRQLAAAGAPSSAPG